jgi:uncharacterized glyoxalase superfamily protein PhnB
MRASNSRLEFSAGADLFHCVSDGTHFHHDILTMPTKAASPIPAGYRTITPYLVIRDPRAAIEFYQRAFDAQEVLCLPGPDGKSVMHAELQIGDSMLMLSGEWPDYDAFSPQHLGNTPVSLHLYVPDADAAFQRAVAAGCTAMMPPTDMFWGDRFAKVADPFGHKWSLATHQWELTEAEIAAGMKAAFQ